MTEKVIKMPNVGYSDINEVVDKNNIPLARPLGTSMSGINAIDLSREMAQLVNAPIRELATGRVFIDKTATIAAISPILGQYAGRISYPDDWGAYWEYLYGYLLVPEIYFALNLKNRLVWAAGWNLEASDDKLVEKVKKRLKAMRFQAAMSQMSQSGYEFGNSYAALVTDADYTWNTEGDVYGDTYTLDHEPTKLYGFKIIDPRTMRRFADPWNYDPEINDVKVIKFIQRVYTAPLGPRPKVEYLINKRIFNEINTPPELMLHLRFNRIFDSLYGYSSMRSVLPVIKGYVLMHQFIPLLFQKRADPLLHFKFGGPVYTGDGNSQTTMMPRNRGQIDALKSGVESRNPGEDLFTDFLTEINEVYKSRDNVRGMDKFIYIWRERMWHGLNIPVVGSDAVENSIEIEGMFNEIKENQRLIEDMVNRQILPLLTSRDIVFKFNDLVPEDWMSKSRVITQLFQSGLINGKSARFMLGFPEDWGKGAMPVSVWGMNPSFTGKPALGSSKPQAPPEARPPRMKSPKASSQLKSTGLSKPKDMGANRVGQRPRMPKLGKK